MVVGFSAAGWKGQAISMYSLHEPPVPPAPHPPIVSTSALHRPASPMRQGTSACILASFASLAALRAGASTYSPPHSIRAISSGLMP
ncbi:hypothetical protein EVG20_g9297 [Dentipellis fragilis]|uniref:Uncharacterized protein n=1 Tax=Dentipellis fragilis TaxID=205917 RepID=A0A4Y9Y1N8_9AGAM|nr:hypothetical protein EVG20_g9297 [Dentipellis fragilis]